MRLTGRAAAALLGALVLAACAGAAPAVDATRVDVDAARIVKRLDPAPLGINVNYLADDDAERPPGSASLAPALREMGISVLRYPGGEKSDGYLWSVPPFDVPEPTLARTGPDEWPAADARFTADGGNRFVIDPLDFDEFIRLARDARAEPVVVVAFDSMYKRAAAGGRAPSRQQLLETAVAWVRYANVLHDYDVRYWELGNESYVRSAVNGAARSAREYARDAREFAIAMKAVDPSILVGVNGLSPPWWDTVLAIAGDSIDFLAVHAYPVGNWQHGYADFLSGGPAMTRNARIAACAIAKAERRAGKERWFVAMTELGAIRFDDLGWRNTNDLGHALVLFDLVGRHLELPGVRFVQTWGTRFPGSQEPTKEQDEPNATDALAADNSLLAHGLAVSLWGRFLGDELVFAKAPEPLIAYASRSTASGALTLYLLNAGAVALDAEIKVRGYAADATGAVWLFSGSDLQDAAPELRRTQDAVLRDGRLSLRLPAYSISVVSLVVAPTDGRERASRTAHGRGMTSEVEVEECA